MGNADCEAEENDLVIIGGGVAGYVAAIKAGQAGLKVRKQFCQDTKNDS
jgi:thioredoxin reductase